MGKKFTKITLKTTCQRGYFNLFINPAFNIADNLFVVIPASPGGICFCFIDFYKGIKNRWGKKER